MGSGKSEISTAKGTKVSAAQSDWDRTVEAVSGLFGKLVYLAGLRDDSTGQYKHYGFSHRYSDELTSTVLRSTHEEIFSEWLTLPIEEQRREIESHWSDQGSDPNLVVDSWLLLEPYRRLIPASALPAERDLYLSDIEVVLDVIRGGASSVSSSS